MPLGWSVFMAGILGLAAWAVFIAGVVLDQQIGEIPLPPAFIIPLWIAFGLLLPIAFFGARMRTRIGEESLNISYFPFQPGWRSIPLRSITTAESVTYDPFNDYGGWGVRVGPLGTAYIAGGRRGVRIETDDGTRLLLGSRNPEELEQILKQD